MTTLLDAASQALVSDETAKASQRKEQALKCAHAYFGDYATTLTWDEGAEALSIPHSAWRLHLGMGDNFFLFHRDHVFGDTKYCGWGIVDLSSLGRAYKAVVASHGDK